MDATARIIVMTFLVSLTAVGCTAIYNKCHENNVHDELGFVKPINASRLPAKVKLFGADQRVELSCCATGFDQITWRVNGTTPNRDLYQYYLYEEDQIFSFESLPQGKTYLECEIHSPAGNTENSRYTITGQDYGRILQRYKPKFNITPDDQCKEPGDNVTWRCQTVHDERSKCVLSESRLGTTFANLSRLPTGLLNTTVLQNYICGLIIDYEFRIFNIPESLLNMNYSCNYGQLQNPRSFFTLKKAPCDGQGKASSFCRNCCMLPGVVPTECQDRLTGITLLISGLIRNRMFDQLSPPSHKEFIVFDFQAELQEKKVYFDKNTAIYISIPVLGIIFIAVVLAVLIIIYNPEARIWWNKKVLVACSITRNRWNYDIFMVYADTDEDRVMELISKLEHRYSLCLPGRDFQIGSVIPQETIEKLKSSTMALVAVSNQVFVQDCWADTQIQMTLKVNRPVYFIKLEKLNNDLDSRTTLRAGLKICPSIEYPSDDGSSIEKNDLNVFYEQLFQLLPKPRVSDDMEGNGSTVEFKDVISA